MKDSYEQRIQNQFGAFCVRVLKNEARHIQRDYASLLDQEKPLDELTASELEQTAVWDDYFMDEHVFEVLGLPVVVTGNVLADALAQLPESKRDVILLSYFLGMTDREISEKLHIVHQTVSNGYDGSGNQRKAAYRPSDRIQTATRYAERTVRISGKGGI